MPIKAYKVESDDEEGKNWHTIGYATGPRDEILKHFDDAKSYRLRLEPISIVELDQDNNSRNGQKIKYQVFYQRDMVFEERKGYGKKMLFDKSKTFNNEEDAYEFAYDNIPTLMIKRLSGRQGNYNTQEADYVVAARFEGKYRHYDYGGGSDPLTNYDILRCEKGELEKIVADFAKEGAAEIITGVEVKLF